MSKATIHTRVLGAALPVFKPTTSFPWFSGPAANDNVEWVRRLRVIEGGGKPGAAPGAGTVPSWMRIVGGALGVLISGLTTPNHGEKRHPQLDIPEIPDLKSMPLSPAEILVYRTLALFFFHRIEQERGVLLTRQQYHRAQEYNGQLNDLREKLGNLPAASGELRREEVEAELEAFRSEVRRYVSNGEEVPAWLSYLVAQLEFALADMGRNGPMPTQKNGIANSTTPSVSNLSPPAEKAEDPAVSPSYPDDDDEHDEVLRTRRAGFEMNIEMVRDVSKIDVSYFGQAALRYWELSRDGGDADFARLRDKYVRELQSNLTKLAQRKIQLVEELFYDHMVQAPDIDAVATSLGFNYVDDDEIDKDELEGLIQSEVKKATADPTRGPSIYECARQRVIAKDLSNIFAFRYDAEEDAEHLMPDPVLMDMIRTHREFTQKRVKELWPAVDEMRERVGPFLRSAIESGLLPISIDGLGDRLNNLNIGFVDGMKSKLSYVWGSYSSQFHLIELSTAIPENHRWNTFVHEVLHSLGGMISSVEEDKYGNRVVRSIKCGLGIKSEGGDTLFSWLDEAVTEQITQDLLNGRELLGGDFDGVSYQKERKLLKRLIDDGIPKELFIQVYFENYDAARSGHKTPALRKLFRMCNERFGKGYLMTLDRDIRKELPGKGG